MSSLLEKLQLPFKAEEIEWRVGSTNSEKTKGLALAYVTNRAIQNRLDEVFGVFGWQNEFKEWKGNSQICGISVWDDNKNQWITKWDGADDSQTEAVKGGLSDSMKRAAYQWGIGRYLYNLESTWVEIKAVGNPNKPSYVIKEEPKLPKWALPEGYQYKTEQPHYTPPQDIPKKLSDAQVNRAFSIGKSKGYTPEQVKASVIKTYGVTEIALLTKHQYDELCTKLESAESKGA